MNWLATLSYGDLREMTAPKLTTGSYRDALVPVIVLGLEIGGYFAWLYYQEWQMKRRFRRFWEGKDRRVQK